MKLKVKNIFLLTFVLACFNDSSNSFARSIEDVLTELASNNLLLKSSQYAAKAKVLELQSGNTLPATSIEYSPFFRSGQTGLASSELIIKQDFEFPTLYHSRTKAIEAEKEVLNSSLESQKSRLLNDAKIKCLELVYVRTVGDILNRQLRAGDSLLAAYQKKFDMREATQLEINKIKLENAELERELAENDLKEKDIINILIAMNGGMDINLTDLSYDNLSEDYILPVNVDSLLANNLEVKSAESEVNSARIGVSLEKQSWLPSISLGYRRNTELNEASNGVLIGLELPLFSVSQKRKSANARLAASLANLDNIRVEEKTRLNSEFIKLQSLKRTIATYNSSLIEETINLYKRSLDLGQISIIDYYNESSILYQHLQNKARLENDFQTTLASFLRGQ